VRSNTEALGRISTRLHLLLFQAAGLVLLVAMIGAIVLTLRHREGVKRQQDRRSRSRRTRRNDAMSKKVERGGGLSHDRRIGIGHYLTVAAILFTIGMFGIFLNRKNVIVILMSVELILLAVNINLVAFSAFLGDLTGQVFAMFVLTVAAAEAAIGLAILVSSSATAARSRSKTST
jgi:NADH-quinone oxidoreductase subunit K